jgi:acetyl esterase/lipase
MMTDTGPPRKAFLRPELAELLDQPNANLSDPREARKSMASTHPAATNGTLISSLAQVLFKEEGRFQKILDVVIPGSNGGIPVRLYIPHRPMVTTPVLVLLHGGAFIGGDAGSEHERCLRLVGESGAIVVVPEYRLAPEHVYPAALNDCSEVLDWVRSSDLNSRAEVRQLILAGVSAGAALAAGLVLRHRSERIAGLMLLCPVLDDRSDYESKIRFNSTAVWDSESDALMWKLYLGSRQADEFSAPARAQSLKGFPPTYIQVAEFDPLRDEGIAFATRLLAADVSVDLHLWSGTCHVFDQMVPSAKISSRSVDDQIRFIESALQADSAKSLD